MEKEIKPGVFVGVVTKQQWLQRIDSLDGEDLRYFLSKCNKATNTDIVLRHVFEMSPDEFYEALREIDPEFNLVEDYFTVRYSPDILKP